MPSRISPAKLVNGAFQRIVTNSTATSLNSTCGACNTFLLSVEAQSARVTVDGTTTPTANTGILFLAANGPYFFEGMDGTKIKIARAAAGTIVNVQAWRRS